ncbi:MAG: SDR family oxidoreductase [Methanobacteriaceae archaeon]
MNQVLLTGANGFLGTQIAIRLLKNHSDKIITLIRAENEEIALRRLKRNWWDKPELLEALDERVKVVPGDITLERLGMNDDLYDSLTSSLTHIVHTAADLRLHGPLEELHQTNLLGTQNLIKLALQANKNGKFYRFSHLSTAYVAGKRSGTIFEEDLTDRYGFWSNYEKSKYEAEKALRESNLPYSVFRPGMVVGDSKTGEIKTFNTLYVLLRLYLTGKLSIIPTSSSLTLNPVPVDYVADSVKYLTFNPHAEGKSFHLTASKSKLPTIREIIEHTREWAQTELNIKLRRPIFIPLSSIIQKIALTSRKPKKPGNLNILFTLAPYLDEKRNFRRDNTQKLLGPYNLDWKDYLPQLLEYAVYYGFFHRSERTVQEQVLFRLKSLRFPVKLYDVVKGEIKENSASSMHRDILSAFNSLQNLGVKAGDRVALVGLNSTRYLTLEVAIGLIGAISVPIYYTSPPIDINNVLKASGTKIVFIGTPHLMKRLDELYNDIKIISFCRESQDLPHGVLSWFHFLKNGKDGLEKIQAPVEFSDLATIRYTSGTTGKPKGVTFNHGNLRWMAESMASLPPWNDRNRDIRYLSFLPMNHVVEGILGTYSPYYAPASLNVYFLEDFNDLPSALPKVRPTIFFSVPRFYEKIWSNMKNTFLGSYYIHMEHGMLKRILKPLLRRILLRKAGLNRCAQLIVGSATSSQQLIQDYHDLGIEIHNAYGLTEAPLVTINRRGSNRIGTVGEPLPETLIKISDDGEVLVKGPQTTPDYYETDLDPPIKQGWLFTGDLGYLTPKGSLVITGRKKELIINSYGKSIDPLRIEALLRDAPGVAEVMLVGEGKPYLSGLLWVDENYNANEIKKTIREINYGLSRPEQVKKWALLPNDLSIDGGELTANMKLKREIISKRYQDVIDSIYLKTPNHLILHLGQLEIADGS